MAQKEDVLLMVKHVRYMKVDGNLFINTGRVAWRNQTSDSIKISASFEDIRMQRISPDTKDKVQLQLLMHNGESFTFQFADPVGREKQLECRNKVKEMLLSLLPKFKDKAQSELKEKFSLLEKNPKLLSLYKELVVSGILTAAEFWARPEFSNKFSVEESEKSKSIASNLISQSNKTQNKGVSNSLLSDIQPQIDGAHSIKYNLSREKIEAIFKAYPIIEHKHRELVPDKLSEADFWVKFFQSHYFHKDRIIVDKDIFSECSNFDAKHIQNEIKRTRKLRVTGNLDLKSLKDHSLGTGFGTQLEEKVPSEELKKLNPNQMLLKRFNHHSLQILKSLGSIDPLASFDQVESTKLKNKLYTSELKEPEKTKYCELNLTRIDDYIEGPSYVDEPKKKQVVKKSLMIIPEKSFQTAISNCLESFDRPIKNKKTLDDYITAYEAQVAISELSSGGCLLQSKYTKYENTNTSNSQSDCGRNMNLDQAENRGVNDSHRTFLLSSDQQNELTMLYNSASELLRHFWACFPVTSSQFSEKLERMNESLKKFKKTKVQAFESHFVPPPDSAQLAVSNNQATNCTVTAHLNEMLNVAFKKYNLWKASQIDFVE